MCLTVYIASDTPLPCVPWDDGRPAFHVVDATDGYFHPTNPLRVHSTRPHFYAAGSHDGCGCGFQSYGSRWDDEAGECVEDTTPEQAACRRAMADYLAAALWHQPAVEVFTFCSGDENSAPKRHRTAAPADFAADPTLFDLWQAVVVSTPATEPVAPPQASELAGDVDPPTTLRAFSPPEGAEDHHVCRGAPR
jgi:hypothetical protein